MSPLWWIRIRGLWMLPERIDWLRGKLDLVLMGGAMFSKYLIQFSVDGWGSQAMEEVMNIMANSLKRSHGSLSAPDPAAGHHWPTPLPQTPGQSWACLGQCLVQSLLLSPGSWCTQVFVCAFQESVSPVLFKFWWFHGGVNGDLLQESLCHTQVCCTQSPRGRPLLTRTSAVDTQSQFWLSLCRLGMHFVPFPGLGSSANKVLGKRTVPGGPCILEDVNSPGSQEDVVSSWEPAHNLMEDALSGAEILATPCLPTRDVAIKPLCLRAARGWYATD